MDAMNCSSPQGHRGEFGGRRDVHDVVGEVIIETVDSENELEGLVPRNVVQLQGHFPSNRWIDHHVDLSEHGKGLDDVPQICVFEAECDRFTGVAGWLGIENQSWKLHDRLADRRFAGSLPRCAGAAHQQHQDGSD